MKNFLLAFKVLRQLGWRQGFLYIYYQFLLHSGILRYLSPNNKNSVISPISAFPQHLDQNHLQNILRGHESIVIEEAEQIIRGQVSILGGLKQKLTFTQPEELNHWSQHKSVWLAGKDIKLYWEVGRFAWATTLARAYKLNKDEKYALAFWKYCESFLEKNPTNQGLHWASAQEVALRLINICFCYSIFNESEQNTMSRQALISKAIAAHAERIPPTLIYARAQNNNHLITEALGLYTAAALLPKHPKAKIWRRVGWKWLNKSFQSQINLDGSYIQNSNNYHRLMLQCGLWAKMMADINEDVLPQETLNALAAATKHIQASIDESSGQAPNLGPNDGAYILPLTVLPYKDYRPVIQAAGRAFLGQDLFSKGLWDEMAAWLVKKESIKKSNVEVPESLRLNSQNSWASLRAVKHRSRPGHADQLHVELWWRGLNIAQDPGTYLYNAPPPWQNALSGTDVHNTITLNNKDQMSKVSRFLYLDWAQATLIEKTDRRIIAEHDGYQKQGLIHQRILEMLGEDQWQITDTISNTEQKGFSAKLHWLLPDLPCKIEKNTIHLESPFGPMKLQIKSEVDTEISLVRAGELIYGNTTVLPHRGWVSPTYAIKEPALSFEIHIKAESQLNLSSIWSFPKTN